MTWVYDMKWFLLGLIGTILVLSLICLVGFLAAEGYSSRTLLRANGRQGIHASVHSFV